MNFDTQTCGRCYNRSRAARVKVKALIQQLAGDNEKVPSNMLHALSNVRKTQLMDHKLHAFKDLEKQLRKDV
jgi:tRNA 2-thiocytidine biosynthesis protein TtcA